VLDSIDRRDEICLSFCIQRHKTPIVSLYSVPRAKSASRCFCKRRRHGSSRSDLADAVSSNTLANNKTLSDPSAPLIREEVAKCDPFVCRAFNLQLIRFACRSRAVPSSSRSSARHIGIYRPLPPDRPKRIARLHRETIIIVSASASGDGRPCACFARSRGPVSSAAPKGPDFRPPGLLAAHASSEEPCTRCPDKYTQSEVGERIERVGRSAVVVRKNAARAFARAGCEITRGFSRVRSRLVLQEYLLFSRIMNDVDFGRCLRLFTPVDHRGCIPS